MSGHSPALLAVAALMLLLGASALACTANDTLFIQLTATPEPTITPTPLSLATKYKRGDSATVVSVSDIGTVALIPLPGPYRPGISTLTCFPSTTITITDISLNTTDAADKIIYYQINCSGAQGWIAEFYLSPFKKFAQVVVTTADGKGAPVYANADATSTPSDTCPDGTRTEITRLTRNPANDADQNIYAEISCAGKTGYVLDTALAPIS
jgi:hypothetical protein